MVIVGARRLTKQLKVNTHHTGHKIADGHRFTVAITAAAKGRKPNYSYTCHLAAAMSAVAVCSGCYVVCIDGAATVNHITTTAVGVGGTTADLNEVILTAYSLLLITSWAASTVTVTVCCC